MKYLKKLSDKIENSGLLQFITTLLFFLPVLLIAMYKY